jgi:type I restriction enzyme S subunit
MSKQRHIVAYLDSVQARLTSLRELQSATGEELSALLPSVLDRAFKCINRSKSHSKTG